jgi:hypothetical protein
MLIDMINIKLYVELTIPNRRERGREGGESSIVDNNILGF